MRIVPTQLREINTNPDAVSDREHLHRLAGLGWWLVPCHGLMPGWPEPHRQACCCPDNTGCERPGKHPLSAWRHRTAAYTAAELDRIAGDYQAGHYGQPPNYAVQLGRSGLVALDIDQHTGGADGMAAWAALAAGREMPAGPADNRGHALFRATAELAELPPTVELAPGVEFHAGPHLLNTPPSDHRDGRAYRWLASRAPWQVAPPAPPAWLVQRVMAAAASRAARRVQAPAPPVPTPNTTAPPDRELVLRRVRAWLARRPGAVQGQRGRWRTFSTCCALVIDWALTVAEAWPLLVEWNLNCDPPWGERELRAMLEDADKRPGQRGAKLAEDRGGYRIANGAAYRVDNEPPGPAPIAGSPTSTPAAAANPITAADLAALGQPPTPPSATELEQQAREAQAQAAAAAELRRAEAAERRQAAGACCYTSFLFNPRKNTARVARLLCMCWGCTDCSRLLKTDWAGHATTCITRRYEDAWLRTDERPRRISKRELEILEALAGEPALWIGAVSENDWPAVARGLRRRRAVKLRADQGHGSYVVVASQPFRGAEERTTAEAMARLRSALRTRPCVRQLAFHRDVRMPERTADLYLGTVPSADWDRVRRRLHKAGAEYMAIESADRASRRVCATAAFAGAEPMPPPAAAHVMRDAIHSIPIFHDTRKPISTSRRWRLPPVDDAGWRMVGPLHPQATRAEIIEAAVPELDSVQDRQAQRRPFSGLHWSLDGQPRIDPQRLARDGWMPPVGELYQRVHDRLRELVRSRLFDEPTTAQVDEALAALDAMQAAAAAWP